jgi:hypothetical protein
VKYLVLHFGRRLTWAKHIKSKRKQLNLKAKQMNWLLERRSALSTDSKLLLYKAVNTHYPVMNLALTLFLLAKI